LENIIFLKKVVNGWTKNFMGKEGGKYIENTLKL
jgi:hypothetical protein